MRTSLELVQVMNTNAECMVPVATLKVTITENDIRQSVDKFTVLLDLNSGYDFTGGSWNWDTLCYTAKIPMDKAEFAALKVHYKKTKEDYKNPAITVIVPPRYDNEEIKKAIQLARKYQKANLLNKENILQDILTFGTGRTLDFFNWACDRLAKNFYEVDATLYPHYTDFVKVMEDLGL